MMFVPDKPPASPAMSYGDRIGKQLWGCSVEDSPLSPQMLMEIVQSAAPQSRRDHTPGVTKAMEPMRSAFVNAALVMDEGIYNHMICTCASMHSD